MKRAVASAFTGLFLASSLTFGQVGDEQKTFATYQEMRARVGELYAEKNYSEAAAVLERALDQFPERILANTYNLATMYVLMGNPDKGMALLESSLERGIWYGTFDFAAPLWTPVKDMPSYKQFAEKNEVKWREAQKKTAMKLEIVTPEGYSPDKPYPLFIALHGGGENIAALKPNWVSEKLKKEYIVAFVQSSQIISMDGYWWDDVKTTAKEVGEAYRSVCEKHSIRKEDIIVGGFSSGGMASLVVSLTNTIPAGGFIALCPGVPEQVSDAEIRRAAGLGVRGTIITTEMDERREAQRQFADRLNRLGLQYQFSLTPNIGHWYPKDLDLRIDQAIEHIRNR